VSSGRAFFVYTGLRLILLLAVGGVLYLTGARGFMLILLAFLLSGALSLIWLDKPRGEMSAGFGRMMGRMNAKIDENAAKEDHLQPSLQQESADDESGSQPEASEQKR
jgi:hypothetical protein